MKKFGFGGMRLPLLNRDDPKSVDQQQVNEMVDKMLEAGFTYFDTAYPYHNGMSEVAFGNALVKRHPRDSFLLADKMPTFLIREESKFDEIFQEQLRRTGVEYFDYYLLHNIGAGTYHRMTKLGAFAYLQKKKEEGKIRRLGFSFHDNAELLDQILTEHPEMEFVQLQINYLDWESVSIQSRKNYEVAVKHNKPVFVMEPVKGGGLARLPEKAEQIFKAYHPTASNASWALRFAASLPQVAMVLSGMSSLGEVEDNISFMSHLEPITEEEKKCIHKVTDIINASTAIACTGCGYCTEECPKKINIPGYFSVYNAYKLHGDVNFPVMQYLRQAHGRGKASECIGCGQCERHCPQHLSIISYLKDVANAFEPNMDPNRSF
ncbi:MAG: aldo/keto reductase [Clostridiales bacterium]|nr:aldo/keto reductase [Clostridiales bacterium]